MCRRVCFIFTVCFCSVALLSSNAQNLKVTYQTRDAVTGSVVLTPAELLPEKTAVIIIDMWNFHWCMTATERVSAMVPRMNEVLRAARQLGMQVIWNPSDVVSQFSGYPSYERAVAVNKLPPPSVREPLSVKFTAPGGGCMCGPGISCRGNLGWDSMHPGLTIDERDLISSSTDEIYPLLKEKGITHIIYMGVHTNMCVFGKPGAISDMWRAGFHCILARDLNDAITIYQPDKGYTPEKGTTEINENLQQAGIPNMNVSEEFRKAGLIESDSPLDYVRFTPWGKPGRPYLMEEPTVVTLTAPWMEGTEIRYTTDGSEPTVLSPLYTNPIRVAETMTVRAAAFREGRQVSLPGYAYYVKMNPTPPPLPDVYLEELAYIPNGYTRNVELSMWYPVAGKSYEGQALRIRGKAYERGLGFRAPSSVQYEIKPEYKRFVAQAGIDDFPLERQDGMFLGMHSSVVFRLFIDGVMMAESPVMRITQEPWRFDIEIPKGSRRLNVVCMDAGSRNTLDYGNWVNAGFITK